jgi:hypothetical protein
VTSPSTEPAGGDAGEQYGADKGPVDDGGPAREALEDAQQAPIAPKDERLATTSPKMSTHQPRESRTTTLTLNAVQIAEVLVEGGHLPEAA